MLIEEHYDEICDELWYIYTSEENRRERLKLNRGYSDEKIDNIFASQLPESTYREVCKEEIDNNHLPEDAFSQIDAVNESTPGGKNAGISCDTKKRIFFDRKMYRIVTTEE